MHGAIGYDTIEEAFKNGHEFVIDSNEMKMHVNINRNETLISERSQIVSDGL